MDFEDDDISLSGSANLRRKKRSLGEDIKKGDPYLVASR